MKRRLVAIVGPTASGKTALAKRLALKFSGEIVSADSRQVYRGMDIGTGKEKDLKIPQHLIDIVNPTEQLTVAEYQRLAYETIEQIFARGHIPFLVGGSGLYIEAVLKGYTIPAVPPDPEIREALSHKTNEELLAELQRLDPKTAEFIDARNKRRLVRALEVIYATGKPFSEQRQKNQPNFEYLMIGIDLPRDELYRRIDERVDARLEQGMVDEVKRLHEQGVRWQRLEEFGLEYQHIAEHLQGKLTYDVMVSQLKTNIHAFARHQYTWFKRWKEIRWARTLQEAEQFMRSFLKSV